MFPSGVDPIAEFPRTLTSVQMLTDWADLSLSYVSSPSQVLLDMSHARAHVRAR